ncbi:MAG: FecR domain-containing protein, partial [Verrucomicrobiota bacterium]
MKQTRKLFNWLIAGGVALAMVTNLAAQTVKESTGQVVRIKGAARYSTGNGQWQKLTVGTKLKSGDLVQSAANSYVDIILGRVDYVPSRVAVGDTLSYQPEATQDVIRVWEDSVLGFDKLTTMNTGAEEVTDTQLDLRAGRILGMVKKMPAASRYEIKLPNGVAGVRGTIYRISAAGIVQVLSGAVVISWTSSDGSPMTQVVDAGYQFDLRTGLLDRIPDLEDRGLRSACEELRFTAQAPPKTVVVD